MTSRSTCKRPTRPPARFRPRDIVIVWDERDHEFGYIYQVMEVWPRPWDRSRSSSRYRYLIVNNNSHRYLNEQKLREP
jgi:hypothetical protein